MGRRLGPAPGRIYYLLTVIGPDESNRGFWKCRCRCGIVESFTADALRTRDASHCSVCEEKKRAAAEARRSALKRTFTPRNLGDIQASRDRSTPDNFAAYYKDNPYPFWDLFRRPYSRLAAVEEFNKIFRGL